MKAGRDVCDSNEFFRPFAATSELLRDGVISSGFVNLDLDCIYFLFFIDSIYFGR